MSDKLDRQIDEAFKRKAEENLDKTLDLIIEKYLQKGINESPHKALKARRKELKLSIPLLQMNENFGQEGTIEREELENIVAAATKGAGDDPFDRFRMLSYQMKKVREGMQFKEGEVIYNPAKWIAQIMLIETMNRMFKSFQASPAGFVNEGFASVFYAGNQVDASTGNSDDNIGDIMVKEQDGLVPISLKTKSGDYTAEGSVKNLYRSINKYGKVYFDIFAKEKSEDDEEVSSMVVYRFTVDKSNINEFLSLSHGPENHNMKGSPNTKYFFIDDSGDLVPYFRKEKAEKGKKYILVPNTDEYSKPTKSASPYSPKGVRTNRAEELAMEAANKILNVFIEEMKNASGLPMNKFAPEEDLFYPDLEIILKKKFSNEWVKDEYLLEHMPSFLERISSVTLEAIRALYDNNKHRLRQNDIKKFVTVYEILKKNLSHFHDEMLNSIKDTSALTKTQARKYKTKEGVGYLSKFYLDIKHWMPFHEANGPMPVKLEFSSEQIKETISVLVEHMHDSMINLVNDIELMADTFNHYLTDADTKERNSLGKKAIEISKRIKPETEKAVGMSK